MVSTVIPGKLLLFVMQIIYILISGKSSLGGYQDGSENL